MAGYNGMNSMGYTMPNQGYPNYTMPNHTPNSYSGVQSQMSNPYSSPVSSGNMSMGLPGRMVSNENEITPNEIPMDGTMGFFPKNDYSCIYVRGLNSDWTPRNIKFVPETSLETVLSEDGTNSSDEASGSILDQVNELINTRFDDLERLIKRNNNNRNYKKPYKKPYDKNNQNGSGFNE